MKDPLLDTMQKMQKTLTGFESTRLLLKEQQKILDSPVKYALESVSGWVADLKAQTVSELSGLSAQTASKWAGFNLPTISELAGVTPPAALKLPDFKMPPTIIEHLCVSEAMGVTAATAARDYLNSFTQTLRENLLVNSSLVNFTDLTRHSGVTELLRPLKDFEEQAKAMNVAALGYDAVHLTAFSAIQAVTEQFKFFQTHIGVHDLFPNVPLYQLLTDLAELEPEEFETEEGELKAVVEKLEEFLKTLLENAKKYPSDLVSYFGQANLILFLLSVLLGFYLSSQSASPEDVQDVEHQVEDVKHQVETVQRDLEQQAKTEAEQQKRLEEKIDRLTAMLEKWSNELSKQQQSLPPAEKSTLYLVTENIEIHTDSSFDSATIAALSANEPVMVVVVSGEWMQIQFFDYLFGELKTGWVQKSYLEPLTLPELKAGHTTTPTNHNKLLSPSFIQRTPGVCGGNARVRNTRIPVWTLVAFHQEGMTDEQLLYNYPSLTPDDLATAWEYYEEHQSEIDQAIADQDED